MVLPLQEKLDSIKQLDRGDIIKKVACVLGIGEVTGGDWWRNRAQIVWVSQRSQMTGDKRATVKSKTIKNSEYTKHRKLCFCGFNK